MKEILLCKCGEIVLKGLNKAQFESMLIKNLRFRLKKHGEIDIHSSQSTVYVEPKDENIDVDDLLSDVKKVFGFVTVSRAAVLEKDMDAICGAIPEYLPQFLNGVKTFKVESKRSDKRFPLASPQISAEVGGKILGSFPYLKVDVHSPDLCVYVEVRESSAYIHAGKEKGAGGMPCGSNGKGLLLLSGGIDSPVAGYMMAKRGLVIDAVHFESFPYTSEMAREKVFNLAGLMSEYCGRINLRVCSLTKIQEELVKCCDEDYFTLLLRRSMMRIAQRVAKSANAGCLITGESLGQVASQTMEAINVTDAVADMPVFRPCIGMDKEEIVRIARHINTFETSIQPYEDCCTVFTPKHPKTKPELEKVLAEEAKWNYRELENEAFENMTGHTIKNY